MKPKITVATPVYNREDCIVSCIESVLNQSILPFEMLIVNDGSKDATNLKIIPYIQNYPWIKLINSIDNKGVNYSRNRCVENAKGDFILWLDSDDVLLYDAIQTVLAFITTNPNYEHYMFTVSDRESEIKNSMFFKGEKTEICFDDWLTSRITGDFVHVMKKTIFKDLPFFEEIRAFEGVNFLRIHKRTKIQLFVNKVITIRDRNRSDSISIVGYLDNKRSIREQQINLNYFLKFFSEDSNIPLLREKIQRSLILGISISDFSANKNLFKLAEKNGIKYPFLKISNNFLIAPIFYWGIVFYSRVKRILK